jgi:transcriptional regulator GlxA family with amidase domain
LTFLYRTGHFAKEEPSPFQVFLIAQHEGAVAASGGLRVIPDYTLGDCPHIDIMVVPGGWGTRQEINNSLIIDWIAERAEQAEIVTSVCTGAMLLGRASLLDKRRATTHWRSLEWVQYGPPVHQDRRARQQWK